MSVFLLPSPLLPASAYATLLDALAGGGRPAVLADPSRATSGGVLVERWSAVAHDLRPTLLLAHSNAGYLAPAVRARAAPTATIVFVDAALPAPQGRTALAPATFRAFAASLADDTGLLPPWTSWWPRETVEALVPGDELERLEQECPRLGLAYLDSTVEAPEGWAAGPNAYLAFGDTYAEEVAFAGEQDWPSLTREGGHLQLLWTPHEVAADIEVLELQARAAPPR